MKVESFKDLKIWQHSRVLAKEVYVLTARFPKQETYGLAQQMRRSAISILSNIAESSGRNSLKDYLHFLHIARGSCNELYSQIVIAQDLDMIETSNSEIITIVEETGRMLTGLIKSLKSKLTPNT